MIKGTNEVFSDKMSIHFCELKKLSKKPNPDNSRELWLQFINADSEEELEMINQTNIPIMQKAVRVIYDMSEDTKLRETARLREKALHDEASALKQAKNEGREEGRAEERAAVISKMKAAGLSESEIQRILNS